MTNAIQFHEVAKVCKDFRAIGAKVTYARNAKGEEKGKEVRFNRGENLLDLVQSNRRNPRHLRVSGEQ